MDPASPQPLPEPVPEPVPPVPEVVPEPDALLPWRVRKPAVEPPAEWPYGYVEGKEMRPVAGREELAERVRQRLPMHMAWTPDAPRLVWPEEVPEVFEEIRRDAVATARGRLWLPALAFVGLGLLAAFVTAQTGTPGIAAVLTGIAFIYAALRASAYREALRMTPASFRGDVEDTLHGEWVETRPAPWTRVLAGCVAAVGVAQLLSPGWFEAAALVKPRVWAGEGWRLGTAVLLHGGPVHFFFNFTALLALGRFAEVHAHRVFVPLVFVVSALSGSVFSLLLMPQAPSVGASGGILGLSGFLVVLARRRRRVLPPGFARIMLVNVIAVAVLGIFGMEMIDNAAHAGGFLAGVALGALVIPPDERAVSVGWRPTAATRAAGWAAAAVLVVGAAATALWLLVAGREVAAV